MSKISPTYKLSLLRLLKEEPKDVTTLAYLTKSSISLCHTALKELIEENKVVKFIDGIVVKYKIKRSKLRKRNKRKLLRRRCKNEAK